LIYSHGKNTTQYNLGGALDYVLTMLGLRMLRRSQWFYSGFGAFLQSSQQGIQFQPAVGLSLGRLSRTAAGAGSGYRVDWRGSEQDIRVTTHH
jgi:hypothetical protein